MCVHALPAQVSCSKMDVVVLKNVPNYQHNVWLYVCTLTRRYIMRHLHVCEVHVAFTLNKLDSIAFVWSDFEVLPKQL